jgi:hypothetical protein
VSLLADKDEADLAESYGNAPVAARVTSVGFARLHILPPVHEDLDHPLGFLSSKVLAQKLEQLRLIAAHDIEHTSCGLRRRDTSRARRPRAPLKDLVRWGNRPSTVELALSFLPGLRNRSLLRM